MEPSNLVTIQQATDEFIQLLRDSRSAHTARTYHNGLSLFIKTLHNHRLPPDQTSVTRLNEDAITWFATDLKVLSPATERLYLTAVVRFYEYLTAERFANPNLTRLKLLIRNRSRRPGIRLPLFPQSDIEILLDYAINLTSMPVETIEDRLRNLRDRAFLVTLADTGLRVHEACELHRGDIDWNEGRAIIIG